jgi:hypothetical protein
MFVSDIDDAAAIVAVCDRFGIDELVVLGFDFSSSCALYGTPHRTRERPASRLH